MLPPIFLDTVGMIAVWDRSDQWHMAADHALMEMRQQQVNLFTTSFVLMECGNAAARKPYRKDVLALKESLERSSGLLPADEQDWLKAWERYRIGYADHAGIVDQPILYPHA